MADAQQRLPLHLYVVGQQQVKVLRDRAGQAVLDGNHRGIHFSFGERGKDFRGERAGNDRGARNQLERRLVAE